LRRGGVFTAGESRGAAAWWQGELCCVRASSEAPALHPAAAGLNRDDLPCQEPLWEPKLTTAHLGCSTRKPRSAPGPYQILTHIFNPDGPAQQLSLGIGSRGKGTGGCRPEDNSSGHQLASAQACLCRYLCCQSSPARVLPATASPCLSFPEGLHGRAYSMVYIHSHECSVFSQQITNFLPLHSWQ